MDNQNFDLYTELVMEHGMYSPHKHKLDGAEYSTHGINPNCGDDITLEIRTKNNKIEDIAFTGSGCAISQSSTSIMIETLQGKTLTEAKKIISIFIKLLKREKVTPKEKELLCDAIAFENISNMPARTKCATMPWHTMEDLLKQCEKN